MFLPDIISRQEPSLTTDQVYQPVSPYFALSSNSFHNPAYPKRQHRVRPSLRIFALPCSRIPFMSLALDRARRRWVKSDSAATRTRAAAFIAPQVSARRSLPSRGQS